MSKKDDSPAISLFSFQDIITSITGIMFLVVLLLVLLIFEAPQQETKSLSKEDTAARNAIRMEITQLRKMLSDYQNEASALQKQIEELKKVPLETQEIEAKKLEAELQQLVSEDVKTRKKINESKTNQQKLLVQTKKQEDENKKLQLEAAQRKKDMDAQKKKLAEIKEKMKRVQSVVRFSVDKASSKHYLLAECGPDGFRVNDLSAGKVIDLRKKNANDETKLRLFLEWAKTRDKLTEAFSIIFTPATLKYEIDITNNLRNFGFEFGLEFLPNDSSSIFADAGGPQ